MSTALVVFVLAGRLPELYLAVLGSLKNGTPVSPLFSAFGPEPIATRLNAGSGTVLVTTTSLYLKKVAKICDQVPSLRHVLVVPDEPDEPLRPGTRDLTGLLAGASDVFTTVAMTSTNGSRFEAAIPPQPIGTRVYYALSAGPADLPTHHPAGFPAEWHEFDITPPLVLGISGLPGQWFSVEPGYGLHTLASNAEVQAPASFPVAGTTGWRSCPGRPASTMSPMTC